MILPISVNHCWLKSANFPLKYVLLNSKLALINNTRQPDKKNEIEKTKCLILLNSNVLVEYPIFLTAKMNKYLKQIHEIEMPSDKVFVNTYSSDFINEILWHPVS